MVLDVMPPASMACGRLACERPGPGPAGPRPDQGNVGVLASIDLRNLTTFARSAALASVSTPPVPALRWVTLLSTSSSVVAEPLWRYGAPANTETRLGMLKPS